MLYTTLYYVFIKENHGCMAAALVLHFYLVWLIVPIRLSQSLFHNKVIAKI